MITFELPFALPLWNQLRKLERWEYARARKALSWEVHAAIHWSQRPPVPINLAYIRVERYSTGSPDPDGLSAKGLFDVLQPASARHPNGLGIIVNDDRAHLTHDIVPMRVKHHDLQKTVVTIEDRSAEDFTLPGR